LSLALARVNSNVMLLICPTTLAKGSEPDAAILHLPEGRRLSWVGVRWVTWS